MLLQKMKTYGMKRSNLKLLHRPFSLSCTAQSCPHLACRAIRKGNGGYLRRQNVSLPNQIFNSRSQRSCLPGSGTCFHGNGPRGRSNRFQLFLIQAFLWFDRFLRFFVLLCTVFSSRTDSCLLFAGFPVCSSSLPAAGFLCLNVGEKAKLDRKSVV